MINREAEAYDETTEEVCEACEGLMRGGPEACCRWCGDYQEELDREWDKEVEI